MSNGNPVGRTPKLIWLGALGAILAWSLASTEVIAVVFRQHDSESGWHYRVQVLGIEIDRRDVFGSGPFPKMEAWRTGLALGSAYVGAIAGGLAAFFYGRQTLHLTPAAFSFSRFEVSVAAGAGELVR